MNEINCENTMLAMMAVMDGEETLLSSEQTTAHLAQCKNCRQEFEQMQNFVDLLKKQKRGAQNADLWMSIEKRIGAQNEAASLIGWKTFLLLGAFLVAYKLLEMIPERDFGLFFKFVPLVFVVALFGFLKENPFKINTELGLER
ncbi:MAG: hypothetical protein M3033_03315 [Acidobacteriota bacterium]|nr:hypothetical protein [Acidobacteriota bacterium]